MTPSSNSCPPGMILHAKQHIAKVRAVRKLAKDTWAVAVDSPELGETITPGQFFMIRQATGSDPLLGRPFALFDVCRDSSGRATGVEFGFVRIGKMTTLMSQWAEGEEVSIWGPLGNGFAVPDCQHLICVAGGIGQTPFLGVAKEALGLATYGRPARKLVCKPDTVSLFYGVRSNDYLAGIDEFTLPGLNLRLATDDGSAGHRGYVTELLQQRLQQSTNGVHVYCCGPEPMMKAVADICSRVNTPCWLSLETPMACGFGACFSCVTKVVEPDGTWDYRRTCVEGPVFRSDQLALHE